MKPLTVREACRQRQPLGGTDAQALEGALTMTEKERDDARAVLRSIASTGSLSGTLRAIAMNTLEPGSGDRWLELHRESNTEGTTTAPSRKD